MARIATKTACSLYVDYADNTNKRKSTSSSSSSGQVIYSVRLFLKKHKHEIFCVNDRLVRKGLANADPSVAAAPADVPNEQPASAPPVASNSKLTPLSVKTEPEKPREQSSRSKSRNRLVQTRELLLANKEEHANITHIRAHLETAATKSKHQLPTMPLVATADAPPAATTEPAARSSFMPQVAQTSASSSSSSSTQRRMLASALDASYEPLPDVLIIDSKKSNDACAAASLVSKGYDPTLFHPSVIDYLRTNGVTRMDELSAHSAQHIFNGRHVLALSRSSSFTSASSSSSSSSSSATLTAGPDAHDTNALTYLCPLVSSLFKENDSSLSTQANHSQHSSVSSSSTNVVANNKSSSSSSSSSPAAPATAAVGATFQRNNGPKLLIVCSSCKHAQRIFETLMHMLDLYKLHINKLNRDISAAAYAAVYESAYANGVEDTHDDEVVESK